MNREEKRRFVTGVLVGALSAILFFGILFAGGILLLNREVQKEAEQTFARYKKCTDCYLRNWQRGKSLEALTVSLSEKSIS